MKRQQTYTFTVKNIQCICMNTMIKQNIKIKG
jgi:hypothetical protein